jgi:predicted acylesterase/phospholipase RssA
MMEYISFSASGAHGFFFEGFMRCFEDAGHNIDNVRGISGTSGGAMAALTLALGINRQKRLALLQSMSDRQNFMRSPNVTLMVDRFGFDEGGVFREMIGTILIEGGVSATATMKDLRRLLRLDIVFVAHNLNTGKRAYFSASETPDLSVQDAVFASCCIPFLFAPFNFNNATYCDGGVSEYVPCVFPKHKTLFVIVPLELSGVPKITTWYDFLVSLLRSFHVPQYECIKELMELPQTITFPPCPSVDLRHFDWAAAQQLIHSGYATSHLRFMPTSRVILTAVCIVSKLESRLTNARVFVQADKSGSEDEKDIS